MKQIDCFGGHCLEIHGKTRIGTHPYKKVRRIHNNDLVPEGTGMRRTWEGLGRPSFFMG